MPGFSLGLDIGSISVNTVLIDSQLRVAENRYDYSHGRPFHTLERVLCDLLDRHPAQVITLVATTGSGGKLAAELLGGSFVNEIVAQSEAVARLHPQARTVIEMGGEDSKLLLMEPSGNGGPSRLADFMMNTICAAGTGSFLDQQARRLGVSIEKEFGELALRSENPPRVAGRCSVFAKSDMIHHQQIATPVHDILAGLCFAVARNLKSNLAKGRELAKPVVFQGGVAANAGVVRAFREILGLRDGELIIPEYHASMGAIGAVYHLLFHARPQAAPFAGLQQLRAHLAAKHFDIPHQDPLPDPRFCPRLGTVSPTPGQEVFLGVDVGSLSTNVVLIDAQNNVVARRYLPTAGQPLEAIRRGLAEIDREVGGQVVVRGAGSTGSGRYLTGDFIGADVIRNEITAQATAAIHYVPDVDTVFEIGGQDSKYIRIDGGVVTDFEMNKVCAAGTGSFLEEQAEKLGTAIVDEFGRLALSAGAPVRLGDRCTVFMESDLNARQQQGARKEDLVGGLAYSIVLNYIQKVVGSKRIGSRILFQGGVANNPSVISAFQKVTGKQITVPPHFDVTGAIGVAMLARRAMDGGRPTRFKGFGVSRTPYSLSRFSCGGCANQCEIRKVQVQGEARPLCYGGRCEKYEVDERKRRGTDLPNLFTRRLALLLEGYTEPQADGRPSIGIPRALAIFHQQFPFWRAFFEELGFRVVLSRPTDRRLVTESLEKLAAETCFPVEVMHGHIHDLVARGADYVFAPFVVDAAADKGNPTVNYNCPWIQTYPFMIKAAAGREERGKLLVPALHFRYSPRFLEKRLAEFLQERLQVAPGRTRRALQAARAAQGRFEQALRREGSQVLASLPPGKVRAVLLGRPYNTGDPQLNLGLAAKLLSLDVLPIPLDFLPLRLEGIYADYDMMYWPNGQKILAGARLVAADERLQAVYLSNFRCGPDSFLLHYVREEMRGKPFLQLEVDEHSADAGLITRCEAFLDSLQPGRRTSPPAEKAPVSVFRASPSRERELFFPYMNDGAHLLAAACRSCGLKAQALPMQGERDLELGRRVTSSRECFPMICTTGSILRKLEEPGLDPKTVSFFMPSHSGPCRFGQYHKFQRIILERLGYGEAEIVSPNNRNSYADFSRGQGVKFRLVAWKGLVAHDLLQKLREEHQPYEAVEGESERVYQRHLKQLISVLEAGGRQTVEELREAVRDFRAIRLSSGPRKPVVAIVGEIFMRGNPFCSGFLARRLQELGAQIVMAPTRDWVACATQRYAQESCWRGHYPEALKAAVQGFFQERIARRLEAAVHGAVDPGHLLEVPEILRLCAPYIHRDYVGDPPLAFGTASGLARTGISGVANILPFTCLPGTIVASISGSFRRDHRDLPWVDIAYDGQAEAGIDTRLQAFMHQAAEFCRAHGLDRPG